MHAKHAADSEKSGRLTWLLNSFTGPCVSDRRVAWLNANAWSSGFARMGRAEVFGYAPLDREALEAAASIPLDRALEILKDLEGKSSSVTRPSASEAVRFQVQNPSGYVKAPAQSRAHAGQVAVKREWRDLALVP